MKRIFTSLSESLKALAALAVLAGAMTSCDSVLDHDDEDCTIEYRVKFKYDYNMKKVDAFSTQVNSVALYAFDKAGKLVYRKTESGARLAEEDYAMAVELVPGDYEFITWAGLEPAHFHLPELTPGTAAREELKVKMHRNIDEPMEGTAPDNVVRRNHASLFHGRVEDVSFIKYPGTRSTAGRVIATVPLVKNTNNIRVALAFVGDRNTRGTGIDKERFSYAIYDTNGYMDFDNSLLPDDEVTYQPFHLEDGTLTTEAIDGEQQTFPTVTAEFSTARLLETQAPMLEIIDKETGRGVLPHCSLIKYLALLKSQNFIDMPLQEYLDREDHFSIVFFIDSNFTMLKTVIQINEWIVHLNEIEL